MYLGLHTNLPGHGVSDPMDWKVIDQIAGTFMEIFSEAHGSLDLCSSNVQTSDQKLYKWGFDVVDITLLPFYQFPVANSMGT